MDYNIRQIKHNDVDASRERSARTSRGWKSSKDRDAPSAILISYA